MAVFFLSVYLSILDYIYFLKLFFSMNILVTDDLKRIASILDSKGFCCYLVGGAVRNQLLGLEEKDYDLATDAFPEDIVKIFNKVIPTGIKHGTVTILFKGESYEITTFRVDGEYSDGRRPDSIKFTSNIYDDLKRRDFTINSLAYDILNEELIDPNNGLSDLKNKMIKAIGDPNKRFQEDGLRPLRACRFAAQLNFTIEKNTLDAIGDNLDKFKNVSKERIYDELVKTMKAQKPSITFKHLETTGLLKIISKDLYNCKGVIQRERHIYDVLNHLFITCDNCPAEDSILRFAGLFHDLGKATVINFKEDGTPTFHNHESASVDIAEKLMRELRFPNSDIRQICHLIKHHMFDYKKNWTDAAVRRFISRVGLNSIDQLLLLQKADLASMKMSKTSIQLLDEFKRRIDKSLNEKCVFSIKDLKINGYDLIKEVSIPKSPVMGKILARLLDIVLDDPSKNEKDFLKEEAKKIYLTLDLSEKKY